jgi:hypothetical protein
MTHPQQVNEAVAEFFARQCLQANVELPSSANGRLTKPSFPAGTGRSL